MQGSKAKEGKPSLRLKCTTWNKDSHSLFDYESNKIVDQKFTFGPSARSINSYQNLNIYRKKTQADVAIFQEKKPLSKEYQDYKLIAHCEIETMKNGAVRVNLLSSAGYKQKQQITNERQRTNESADSKEIRKEQDPYFIVSRFMNGIQQQIGCRLVPGMTLKLGRIEYFVRQVRIGSNKEVSPVQKHKNNSNTSIMKLQNLSTEHKTNCKICLDQHETEDNFLFNPCLCNGSCGTVHYECLTQWIKVKVKKEVVGGTQHYNFTKFQCQICKTQFPGYIEQRRGNTSVLRQLISLQRPQGDYLMLQGACQKQKSIMLIQNTPEQGIKLGRGHECEIRITDISVSRKHALIRYRNHQFYIFDNKSKFGTLVREQQMRFEVGKQLDKKCVQIGRTIIEFEHSK